jgi:aryl-alcohol dehydrogenase-like predicted oxidoreductase
MDLARSHGVTFFDTAAAYGDGASETIIGEWLAAHPHAVDSIMISTKILPPYTSSAIRKSIDQSMERLGVPVIDILYLHRWDPDIASASTLETLHDLVQEGRVRMLGASNFNAAQLSHILQEQTGRGLAYFRTIQNNHNLAVSDVNDEVRDICRQYEIAIVTYSPLGAGFLTGKYREGIQSGTRFSLIPGHQAIYFNERAFSRLAALQAVSSRTGYSPAYLALAWALYQPGIASVLVGGRSTDHLELAFSALAFNDPDIFSELEAVP